MAMSKQILSGVLLLDKPQGISSHEALFLAKKCLMSASIDSKKAGHTGTLDPMATGLLPICFGEATKFSQFGLEATKSYLATIKLGASTNTGDADGQIIATKAVPIITQAKLEVLAQTFLGKILQTPPMYSALKKDGKKLYEYARAGVVVERTARPIVIRKLNLTWQSADTIVLEVCCSKGTYVRVLAEDIAQSLGTVGHLTTLRRTATGGFEVAKAITLTALEALDDQAKLAQLYPVDSLLAHLPAIYLGADEIVRLRLGQRLNAKAECPRIFAHVCAPSQQVRLYQDNVFVGLGELEKTGRLQPKKMLF